MTSHWWSTGCCRFTAGNFMLELSSKFISRLGIQRDKRTQMEPIDSEMIESIVEDYVAQEKKNVLNNCDTVGLEVRGHKNHPATNALSVLLRKASYAPGILIHSIKILSDSNRSSEEKCIVLNLLTSNFDTWATSVFEVYISCQVVSLMKCEDRWLREQACLALGISSSPGSLNYETVRELAISLLRIATSDFSDPMSKLIACSCLIDSRQSQDARYLEIIDRNVECLALVLSDIITLVRKNYRLRAIRLLSVIITRHFKKSFRIFKSLTLELTRDRLQAFIQPQLDKSSLGAVLDLFGSLIGHIQGESKDSSEMLADLSELWPDYLKLFTTLLKYDQLDRSCLRTIIFIIWNFGDSYYVSDQVIFELLDQKVRGDLDSFAYITPILADLIVSDKQFKLEQNLESIVELCQMVLNDATEEESLGKNCAAKLLELLVRHRWRSLDHSLAWIVELAMMRLGCCIIQSGWRERLTLVICAAMLFDSSSVLKIFQDIDYVWSRSPDMSSLDMYIAHLRNISGNYGDQNHKDHCKRVKKHALEQLFALFRDSESDLRYNLNAIEAEKGEIEVCDWISIIDLDLGLFKRAHSERAFLSWIDYWMDSTCS